MPPVAAHINAGNQPVARRAYSGFWAAAAALIAVQTMFILYSRRHDYFFLDDFLGFIVARTSGMNFAYLTHDVFGQFAPGYRLLDYLYIQVIGLHYSAVRLFDIVTISATTLLLLGLIRRWRLPPAFAAPIIAFIPFSPIFVVLFQWFSSALHVYAAMVFAMSALLCMADPKPLTERRRIIGAILFAFGLLFYAKMLFLSVLLFAVRMFVSAESGSRMRDAFMHALRDLALFIPLAVIYLCIVALGHYSSGRPPTGILPILSFVRVGFLEGFAANLFGLDPALPGRTALACTLLLLPMALSVMRNARSLLIWAGFLIQFILAMAAVAYGRVTIFGPEVAALSRYHTETAVFYLACLIICFATVRRPAEGVLARRRMTSLDWGGLAAGIVLALVLGHASLKVPLLYAPDDGRVAAYVSNFRRSLLDKDTDRPIFDATVPDWVMPAWMAPLNRIHDFALLFPVGARFTNNKQGSVSFDETGQLRPVIDDDGSRK